MFKWYLPTLSERSSVFESCRYCFVNNNHHIISNTIILTSYRRYRAWAQHVCHLLPGNWGVGRVPGGGKKPLWIHLLAQNKILSAEKAPAGLFNDPFYKIFRKKNRGTIEWPFFYKKKNLRDYLMTPFTKYSNTFVFQSTNYTTLGPKIHAKLVSAITRRRSKLWWRKAHQSKALDDIYNLAVSKRDLKHVSKSDLPGFAGGAFMNFQMLFNDFEMFC